MKDKRYVSEKVIYLCKMYEMWENRFLKILVIFQVNYLPCHTPALAWGHGNE